MCFRCHRRPSLGVYVRGACPGVGALVNGRNASPMLCRWRSLRSFSLYPLGYRISGVPALPSISGALAGGADWWGVVDGGIDWWGEYDSFLNPRRYDPWWYDLR